MTSASAGVSFMVLMGYWESLIVRWPAASWDVGHISSKRHNFPATPPRIKPPQETAPDASAERAPVGKMHNFLGTPITTPRNFACRGRQAVIDQEDAQFRGGPG